MDAGASDAGPLDAGASFDAGSVQTDAGIVLHDAGFAHDSGVAVDSGVSEPDASPVESTADAGWKPPPTNEELFGAPSTPAAGCSCRTTGDGGSNDATGGAFALVSVLVILGMRRRASR
jgi:MYXO-CTERM domain-containing protein